MIITNYQTNSREKWGHSLKECPHFSMVKDRYRHTLSVLIVFGVCIFCLSLIGCKRRSPPSSKGIPPFSDSAMTVDVINGIPEVRVLEEFNDESVSVKEPAAVSVEAESAAFVPPTPKEIQTALKNAGYYSASIDGKIGPKSQQAIRDFQRDNRLKVDGKVGKKTWSKLKKYLLEAGD